MNYLLIISYLQFSKKFIFDMKGFTWGLKGLLGVEGSTWGLKGLLRVKGSTWG